MTSPFSEGPDAALSAWHGPATTYGGNPYGELMAGLREFLTAVACARPTEESIAELANDLADWTERLQQVEVSENEQVYARRADLPGRGQVTWPVVRFTECDEHSLEGVVTFSRFFLGRKNVVHGGAIMLVFDEVAGRMAHVKDRTHARTAFLRTDFRAPAPIDTELNVKAMLTRVEGRKRFIKVSLFSGKKLYAEAETLMVSLLHGQP